MRVHVTANLKCVFFPQGAFKTSPSLMVFSRMVRSLRGVWFSSQSPCSGAHCASLICGFKLPPKLGNFRLFFTSPFYAPLSLLSSETLLTRSSGLPPDTVPLFPGAGFPPVSVLFFTLSFLLTNFLGHRIFSRPPSGP